MSSQFSVFKATENRLLRRGSESLIGIASGLVADGDLNDKEIIFLSTWLSENHELSTTWPGEVIFKIVTEVLSDGLVTKEERDYLHKTLSELVGGSFADDGAISSESTSLPINEDVIFEIPLKSFCFTGQFLFGTRSACEKAVTSRGGRISGVNKKLDILVIGDLSSRDWKYSSFGGKIESAVKIRNDGSPLLIVSEKQWIHAL